MTRISSKAYRDGARDQPCTLRCSPECDGGGETTVFAHIRDRHTGTSIKASDISGCDACAACHQMLDSAWPPYLASWHFYALRGLQETLENRIQRGILIMPTDATETRRTSSAKPGKIAGRPMPKSSRPIPSRPMRAKK
jgi:hypothetical protein